MGGEGSKYETRASPFLRKAAKGRGGGGRGGWDGDGENLTDEDGVIGV